MERTQNRALPLILAREFAANVATPLAVFDADGGLIFFNEPAEEIMGPTSTEVGELAETEWRARFSVERPDGSPIENEDTPTAVARREMRPTHDTLVYTMLDGARPLSLA